MGFKKDLSGHKYGRLLVLGFVGNKTSGKSIWKCKCDCGNVCNIEGQYLISGHTRSCGCIRHEHYESMKLEYGLRAKKDIYAAYKHSAKKRKLSFDITLEFFLEITQQDCYYCGCPPTNKQKNISGNGDYVYNGIDRVNSKMGYTPENCVPCCGKCNEAKNDTPKTEFLVWVRKVYNHMNLGET